MERLLKTREVAALWSVSEAFARKMLTSAGAKPIDLGAGRGRGLRWRASDIEGAIKTGMPTYTTYERRKPTHTEVVDMTLAELFDCVNQKNPLQ